MTYNSTSDVCNCAFWWLHETWTIIRCLCSLSATSTGALQGLDNTNGGVCRTKSMKLVLRVGQSTSLVFLCVNERATPSHQQLWFWVLDVYCNNIISSLEWLYGQIILIIIRFPWREITATNNLKTIIQTSGSLRLRFYLALIWTGCGSPKSLFSYQHQKSCGPFPLFLF